MKCSGCGTESVVGAEFCHKCGLKFTRAGTHSITGRHAATPAPFLGEPIQSQSSLHATRGQTSYPSVHQPGSYSGAGQRQGSYPGQTQGSYPPQAGKYPPTAMRYGTVTRTLAPEERLRVARQRAKIQERYKNPGIAIGAITFGFLAVVLLMLALAAAYFHYAGIVVGVLACVVAIFARRRNNRLAWLGFALGMIAVLGGIAIVAAMLMGYTVGAQAPFSF